MNATTAAYDEKIPAFVSVCAFAFEQHDKYDF